MLLSAILWMFGLKTTGLQFGYFFALLFSIVFLSRGIRAERLSDKMLSAVMFFLAMLIQDYTFGFAGINFLWDQMDGWPRHFPWLFPLSVYFYFLAQTNSNFKLERKHLYHLIPYVIYVLVSCVLLALGLTPKQKLFDSQVGFIWEIIVYIISYGGIFFYFIKSIKIYRDYKAWTNNQFSNTYQIELRWLRNFLWFFLIGTLIHLINTAVDMVYDLPFDQDYYWQLFTVVTILYLGISGLTQSQDKNIDFVSDQPAIAAIKAYVPNEDELNFKAKLESYMTIEKPCLNPDLTLRELAKQMNTNTTFLSRVINHYFEKNFNDYINEYRATEFQQRVKSPSSQHLTLVGIAYDCGFNSKATFNRAIKKITGKLPSEL